MSVYIFAGGGTGGHLYPGLAVAQELLAAEPTAAIVFACSSREIDRKILEPRPYVMVPQPIRPLPRLRSPGTIWPFVTSYLRSRSLAKRLIADLKPAAVLGLGGFAAGPVMVQAARGGIRRAFLNPDAVPGKANQLLARHAQVIFTQFERTADTFAARHRHKVQCVGCPIRPAFAATFCDTAATPSAAATAAARDTAVRTFGLHPQRRTLLVFGGSLSAESVSQALGQLADDLAPLADRWQVLHISGLPSAKTIETRLRSAGLHATTLPYCDRMDLAYAAADVVLSRGGAATVAEIAVAGKAAVIMPYPHHKDHQQKLNAAELEHANAAVVLTDTKNPATNAASLREHLLPILRDEPTLHRMQQAAARVAKPNAAQTVAQWMLRENGGIQ